MVYKYIAIHNIWRRHWNPSLHLKLGRLSNTSLLACRLISIFYIRGGLLRPRPDGGDPAPPAQPAAGRPAGGAPQHQRARAETELHTGRMSLHLILSCQDMVMLYLVPGGWGACECDGHGDGPHDGPGHARHRGGGGQRRRHGRDEHAQPRHVGILNIKYLLSLESSPQQYLIICNIIFSGSIEHFEKLFYPKIPCKNCSTCYENFSDEIKWL